MTRNGLRSAVARLDAWIEAEDFQGWDPYDALNSPLLQTLTFGNRRLGQVWVQALKHTPLNLRPVLGVPKGYNPKAMGLFLASYWRKYLLTGDASHLTQARFFADWLEDNIAPGHHGACWGYNFPWPNRGFFAPAGTPTIVNTAFIGLAFLDLYALKPLNGGPSTKAIWGERPLTVARSACEFILHDLNRLTPRADELCFSYTPLDERYVHNANLLGAALLGAVGAHTGETDLVQTALKAARYTARRQASDGSWLYGESDTDRWVDNFHTGFVLVALKQLTSQTGTDEFFGAVSRGYQFWKTQFFLRDATPKYTPVKTYPIDVHSVAQAILTFLAFADDDPRAQAQAEQVADWGIRHMQSAEGCFHFQHRRHFQNRIPYMRWSQAWMQRAFREWEWSLEA